MQKLFYRALTLIVLLQGTATADTLLEKSTYPTDTSSTSKNCKLTDNGKVIVEIQVSGLKSTQIIPTKLNLPIIKSTIARAALGKIIKPEQVSLNLPSTTYQAYNTLTSGTVKTILLWNDADAQITLT